MKYIAHLGKLVIPILIIMFLYFALIQHSKRSKQMEAYIASNKPLVCSEYHRSNQQKVDNYTVVGSSILDNTTNTMYSKTSCWNYYEF